MPLLGTRGAASVRGFGFASVSLPGGFITKVTSTTAGRPYIYQKNAVLDSSGNIYVLTIYTGATMYSTQSSPAIVKLSSTGALVGAVGLVPTNENSGYQFPYSLVKVSTDNFRVAMGYTTSGNWAFADVSTSLTLSNIKYYAKGADAWISQISYAFGATSTLNYLSYVAYDGSGYGERQPAAIVINASTFAANQRRVGSGYLGTSYIALSSKPLAYDSANSRMVSLFNVMDSSGYWGITLNAINNTGTSGAITGLNSGTTALYGGRYLISSGSEFISYNQDFMFGVTKRTSGTIQWSRNFDSNYFPTGTQLVDGTDIAIDSSGNIYIVAASNTFLYVVKLNSSNAVQWTNKFNVVMTNSVNCVLNNTESQLIITGARGNNSTSDDYTLVLAVPTSGTGQGTYVVGGTSVTYSSESLSTNTNALSNGWKNAYQLAYNSAPSTNTGSGTQSPTFSVSSTPIA